MDTKSAAHKNTWQSWQHMRQRCRSTNRKYLGIQVCERWNSFDAFLVDMGLRPSIGHTIDRFPDQLGNYEPGNCRWATVKQQNLNKSNNIFVDYKGECRLLVEVVEELGLKYPVVYGRLRQLGWTLEQALTVPVRRKRKNRRTL